MSEFRTTAGSGGGGDFERLALRTLACLHEEEQGWEDGFRQGGGGLEM